MNLNRKEYLKVFTIISIFSYFQHREKREKSVAGHESDKLIESYSVEPTDRAKIRVIFDYQAIYKHKMSRSQSVQPVLTDAGLIISSTFSFYDFFSLHHLQQQIQVCQMPSNVKLKSIHCSRDFISVSVVHNCNYFSSPCSGSQ